MSSRFRSVWSWAFTCFEIKTRNLCLPKCTNWYSISVEWWWYYSEITDFHRAEQQNCHRLGKFCFVMAACNLRNAAAFEFSVEEKPWISDSLFSTHALFFQVTAKTTKTRHPCELPTQSPLPVASTTSKWRSSAKGGMGKCYKGWNYWVVWCRKVNSRSRQNVTEAN